MTYLQHFFRVCLLFAFGLIASQSVQATHLGGADLTYEWLGGNDYRVTTVWYRDVGGVPMTNPTIRALSLSGCALPSSHPTTLQSVVTLNAGSPGCPLGITYEAYTFTVDITLSASCRDWEFRATMAARNHAITTIPFPGNQPLCIRATLNNLDFPGNNSPTFGNRPVSLVCLGAPFNINHGTSEPDGDQLVFTTSNPRGSGCGPITYLTPYSPSQPLQSTPPMAIDPATGAITGTATAQDVTITAMTVTEFRNGIIIGTVSRDMQIQAVICTNRAPIASPTTVFDTVCVGQAYSQVIVAVDPDGDNVTMTWGHEIAGATFTVINNNALTPLGLLNWTPTAADIGNHFSQ